MAELSVGDVEERRMTEFLASVLRPESAEEQMDRAMPAFGGATARQMARLGRTDEVIAMWRQVLGWEITG